MHKTLLWVSLLLSTAAVVGVIALAFIVTRKEVQAPSELVVANNTTDDAVSLANDIIDDTTEEDADDEEETYTNEAGYSVTLPAGWSAVQTDISDDPKCDEPSNIVTFADPDSEYNLVFGFRLKGDDVTISCRSGVGAGDFVAGEKIDIAGKKIETTNLVYQGDVTEIFLGDENITIPVPLNGYELVGSFIFVGEQTRDSTPDVSESDQWQEAMDLLASLEISD